MPVCLCACMPACLYACIPVPRASPTGNNPPQWRIGALHSQWRAGALTPPMGNRRYPLPVENGCSPLSPMENRRPPLPVESGCVPLPPQWRTGALHPQWRRGVPHYPPRDEKRLPLPVARRCSPLAPPVENRRSPLPVESGVLHYPRGKEALPTSIGERPRRQGGASISVYFLMPGPCIFTACVY